MFQTTLGMGNFRFQLFLSAGKLLHHGFSLGNFTFGFCTNTDLLKDFILEALRTAFMLLQSTAQIFIGRFQGIQLFLFPIHGHFQGCDTAAADFCFLLFFRLLFFFGSGFFFHTAQVCRIVLALFFRQTDTTFCFFNICLYLGDGIVQCLQGSIFFFILLFLFGNLRFRSIAFFLSCCLLFRSQCHLFCQAVKFLLHLFRFCAEHGNFRLFQLFSQRKELPCCFALFFQRRKLSLQLRNDIFHTEQVLLFFFQFICCFYFTGLILDNPCGFLENPSALIPFGIENLINSTLPNNGIAFSADTCIHKQFLNIFQAAGSAVNAVFTFTGTKYPTSYLYFRKLHRHTPILIVNDNGHFRKPLGFSAFGTGKNNVLHFIPTEAFCTLFSKHPTNSVRNIALAAAVRAYHCRNARIKFQFDFFRERFKTL